MTSSGSDVAICTNSTYAWTFNSLNQSPCQVASYLGGVCNSGLFNIGPLDAGSVYLGPQVITANPCRCSSVFYSLVAACSLCQSREYLKWSSYNGNCTPPYTDWPKPIPAGTKVPHWAFLNVAAEDAFDPQTAQLAGDGPESTAVPASTSSSSVTRSATGGGNTSTGGPITSGGSNKSSSNTGAIAGGVVGGVVGLLLIAALVFWLIRRRRNRLAPSTIVGADPNAPGQMGYNNTGNNTMATPYSYQHTGSTTAYPGTMPSPKLYDPSDPSTFPTTPQSGPFAAQQDHQPLMAQHNTGYSGNGSYQPQPQPPQPGRYTGAPEI